MPPELDDEDEYGNLSLRDQLTQNFGLFEEGTLTEENAGTLEPVAPKDTAAPADKAAEQTSSAPPADGADKASRDRARDDAGRFAKAGDEGGDKPAQAAGEQPPASGDPAQLANQPADAQAAAADQAPPPPHLGQEAAQVWAKASPETRAYIERTENVIAQINEPVKALFTAAGEVNVPWGDYAQNLVKTERAMRSDPVGTLIWMANHAGVDPFHLADKLDEWAYAQGRQPGQAAPAKQQQSQTAISPDQVARLVDTRIQERDAAQQRQAADQRKAAVGREIAAFGAKQPHWETVKQEVYALIPAVRAGKPDAQLADVLKDAYDRAVWANPTARASQLAADKAKADEGARAQRSNRLARQTDHRGGSSSPRPPAMNGAHSGKSMTLREEIEANFAEVNGR